MGFVVYYETDWPGNEEIGVALDALHHGRRRFRVKQEPRVFLQCLRTIYVNMVRSMQSNLAYRIRGQDYTTVQRLLRSLHQVQKLRLFWSAFGVGYDIHAVPLHELHYRRRPLVF